MLGRGQRDFRLIAKRPRRFRPVRARARLDRPVVTHGAYFTCARGPPQQRGAPLRGVSLLGTELSRGARRRGDPAAACSSAATRVGRECPCRPGERHLAKSFDKFRLAVRACLFKNISEMRPRGG
jgi:hypothetical protein